MKHAKLQSVTSDFKTIEEAQVAVSRAVGFVKEAERVLREHGEVPGRWLRPIGPERWAEMGANEKRPSGDDPAICHMEEAGQKIREDGEVPERWRIPTGSEYWAEAEDDKKVAAEDDSSGTSDPIWRTRTGISKLLQEMYDEEAYRSYSENQSARWSEASSQSTEDPPWLACDTETQVASDVIDSNFEEIFETSDETGEVNLDTDDVGDSVEADCGIANEVIISNWLTCEGQDSNEESPNMPSACRRARKFQGNKQLGRLPKSNLSNEL